MVAGRSLLLSWQNRLTPRTPLTMRVLILAKLVAEAQPIRIHFILALDDGHGAVAQDAALSAAPT